MGKLGAAFTGFCYKKEQRNGAVPTEEYAGRKVVFFKMGTGNYDIILVAKNEPVKREKSIVQELGDNCRCNVHDLET